MEELLQTLVKSIEGLQRIAEHSESVAECAGLRIESLQDSVNSLDARLKVLEELVSGMEHS